MSQIDEHIFVTPRGTGTNQNNSNQINSLYNSNFQQPEIKIKFPVSNNFMNEQQQQVINNYQTNTQTTKNYNHISVQDQQYLTQKNSQTFNTPINNSISNKANSSFFVKQQIQEYNKKMQTSNFSNFDKQKSQKFIRPTTAVQKPQWKVLEKHSKLEHMKDNFNKQITNTLPIFSSTSLQKGVDRIKFPQSKRLLQESKTEHVEEQYEKSKKFRSSNYNQHRNAINGINKMIRPEQKVVTELRRTGVKSVDTIEKTLKRLSLVKEDKDAILKQNVNTNIVYDKLMLEYLKDTKNNFKSNKNSKKLSNFQDKNYYQISCFAIPHQKPQQQMFNITTQSLRDLNKRFLEVEPQFVTKKKKQQIQQQKLRSQKHVYSDLYQQEQKKIIKMQQQGNLDIEEYVCCNNPVMHMDQQKPRKILLQAFPPKKKEQHNDNESTDSEPYWYRQLQWERQKDLEEQSSQDDNNENEQKNQE